VVADQRALCGPAHFQNSSLAAQSLLEGLPLVTADPLMETFDIPIVW
jgi:hypothetical protein